MGRRVSKAFFRIAFAVVLVTSTLLIHRQMEPAKRLRERYALVPEPGLAKLLSLGFHSLASDLFWIQTLQAVGGSRIEVTGSGKRVAAYTDYVGKLIDVTTTLDPWVVTPYHAAAVFLVDREESVEKANRLLKRSIAHHPDDWREYYYLGFNHFYYLEENDRAQVLIDKAAHLPGSPTYLPRLAARLGTELGDSLLVAESFLHEMYRGAEGLAKEQYEKALLEIQTEQLARLLDVAREEFKRRNGRDIGAVDELVSGSSPVLDRLPEDPNGKGWTLQPETGVIVSKQSGARYQLFAKLWQKKMREQRRERYLGKKNGEG